MSWGFLGFLGELCVLEFLVGIGELGAFICWLGVVAMMLMGLLFVFLAGVFGDLSR